MNPLDITVRTEKGVGVVELIGDADERSVSSLQNSFAAALNVAGWPLLVINVEKLVGISPRALGTMAALHRNLRNRGGAVVLCGHSDALTRILRIAGLNNAFPQRSNLYEARYHAIQLSSFTVDQVK